MKKFIGVDLHKTMFTVCYLSQDGEEEIREFSSSQLAKFSKTLNPEDEVAVEATGNSRNFREKIVESVSKVVLVDPGHFKVVSSSHKKTDKQDAYLLALYLSNGMLPESRVMDSERARIKSLVGTRDKLVKLRTTLKNKIHTILNANGIVSKKESLTSAKGLEAVMKYRLHELSKIELGILVEQIKHLNEGIEKIEQELKKPDNQLPGHNNLTTIKGVGDITATVLLSVIGDIKDFPDSKKLSAYFGLVPRVDQSNETTHYGRITKRGSKIGRTMLVQCSLVAIRYNPRLRDFYLRIKQRRGHAKAIIATARKLLELVYITLDKELIWEDSNHAIFKECR